MLSHITRTDLSFTGYLDPGLGADGHILLADADTKQHLVLYSLVGDHFTKHWHKPVPENISWEDNNAISMDGKLLISKWDGDEFWMFNLDLILVASHKGNYGRLLSVISGNRVIYSVKIGRFCKVHSKYNFYQI